MLISRVMFYKVSAQERERIVKLDDFRTKIEVIYNNRLRKHEIRKITQIYELRNNLPIPSSQIVYLTCEILIIKLINTFFHLVLL